MKQLANKILAVSLMLFAVITFSSCDKEDFEWRKAEILKPETISVPQNGNITHTITLTKDWVDVTTGGKYIDLEDFTYTKGIIKIDGGPYIDYLTFNILGTDIGFQVDVDSNRGDEINDADPARKHFFKEIVEIIRNNGTAIIAVGGSAHPNEEIDLKLYFEVNAYVSYREK